MNPFTLSLFACIFIRFCTANSTISDHALVNLRIEGESSTIFEDYLLTSGHNVTTLSGGNHHCDGTNNHSHPFPGPTATAALDDASKKGDFTWDGTFFPDFDDFLITKIAGIPKQTNTKKFWHLILNYRDASVGGCQLRVKFLDEILFAFSDTNATLRLNGPRVALKGVPIALSVTNGSTGFPVAGASVANKVTGADGFVSVVFPSVGRHSLKAEKAGVIRSNKLVVDVVQEDDEDSE
ncbi:hypothetical protein H0H93_007673 [Arthromyces matolae]|nr:hypothetical protein H0H93_007673 [Arthromyces matolae]